MPAAPGNPGKPSDPVVLFTEDFQNTSGKDANIGLEEYRNAVDTSYTAAKYWLSLTNCNGVIVNSKSKRLGTLNGANKNVSPNVTWDKATGDYAGFAPRPFTAFANMRSLAAALGNINNPATAADNYVASSYTQGNGHDNEVQFETVAPLKISVQNRFATFSVEAGTDSCSVEDDPNPPRALLDCRLKSAGEEISTTNKPIDVCGDPRSREVPVTIAGHWREKITSSAMPGW